MTAARPPRGLKGPAFLLGFALGGFFDGILLHQILQWHHLLSNVEAARDMRLQILADGLFHALMYAIAAVALVQLWRRRAALAASGAGRLLGAQALVGFGVWHIVDSVVSHWLTGIHRIRVDAPDPWMWDLLWFFAFGVLPAAAGWLAMRKGDRGDGAGGPHDGSTARRGQASAAALALAVGVAGPIAALPAQESGQTVVVFAPGVRSDAAFRALASIDARVVWVDRHGGMWAVVLREPARSWRLYGQGAMLVSNSAVALGCVSWTMAAARR